MRVLVIDNRIDNDGSNNGNKNKNANIIIKSILIIVAAVGMSYWMWFLLSVNKLHELGWQIYNSGQKIEKKSLTIDIRAYSRHFRAADFEYYIHFPHWL